MIIRSRPFYLSCQIDNFLLFVLHVKLDGITLSYTIHSEDLKSGHIQILSGQKEIGLQMVWISNRIWNLEARPFEIWLKAAILPNNI